jgi:hypothetical protein
LTRFDRVASVQGLTRVLNCFAGFGNALIHRSPLNDYHLISTGVPISAQSYNNCDSYAPSTTHP